MTTGELDALAEEAIRKAGGAPTFLGHQGFTKSICASPNAVVVHGIPDGYTLHEGDVIALDVGVTLDGWIADSAVTVPVGPVGQDDVHLLETCRLALVDGLRACRPGNHVGDIGAAVQRRVESEGFSIVPALGGHGVGRQLWEDPVVPNHGPAGRGPRLVEGLVLAIEPIIVAGEPGHRPARRRLDDLDPRRRPRRALRAHRGRRQPTARACSPAPAASSPRSTEPLRPRPPVR